MQIYTLNINGFRGKKNLNDFVITEELNKNLERSKILIDDIICDVDSVIVLQEIPFKILDKTKQPWSWSDNVYYEKFNNVFSNKYKIIKPKHLINSLQCTVALCRKDSLWGGY